MIFANGGIYIELNFIKSVYKQFVYRHLGQTSVLGDFVHQVKRDSTSFWGAEAGLL